MRQRTCGSARDRVGEASGAALGNDDAVSTRGQRGSNDGSEIVRILHTIEQNNQPLLAVIRAGTRENVFERAGGTGGGDGNDSLMDYGIGKPVELPAIFEPQGDALFACELHDLLDAGVLAALGDDDAVDGPRCVARFLHGVNTGEAGPRADTLQFPSL